MNWGFPYPSQRMPVFAQNVVATSQPLASQAGVKVLQKGGNAVDAAIATAIALTVVEPTSNGIGSDAFAIVWDGKELHGLNGSGRSPSAMTLEHILRHERPSFYGWDTVTVPGAVSAWVALSERFGQLPFDALFEDAIHYASDGFLVSPMTAEMWAEESKAYQDFPEFGAAFLPNGHPPKTGELFRFPEQARTLECIAQTKGEAFYRGELAEKISAHAAANSALMTMDDLASHSADWTHLIDMPFANLCLHEIPPSTQGVAALIALGILEHHPIRDFPVDSADSFHCQIEAMKLAFADTKCYVADPAFMDLSVDALLNPSYLAKRAKQIDMSRAKVPEFGMPLQGGTVYLTAADATGMMVSFIQSNFFAFGSGVVIPGTGISMQNRGVGFTLEKGHPNQVAGAKRPFHTIIPGFITSNGNPLMSFGVMGGNMQPQGHVQIVIRIGIYEQNPQVASDAPRWIWLKENKVGVESGFDPNVLDDLKDRGHDIVENIDRESYGGAQIIYKMEDGYCAASDSRKDGQAIGF